MKLSAQEKERGRSWTYFHSLVFLNFLFVFYLSYFYCTFYFYLYYVCMCVFMYVCMYLFIWFFQDRVSLCSPGCPESHSVEQADLKLIIFIFIS